MMLTMLEGVQQTSKKQVVFLLSYVLFGAIHELSHIASAVWYGCAGGLLAQDGGIWTLVVRTLLGRECQLPGLDGGLGVEGGHHSCSGEALDAIRAVGWIMSVVIAFAVHAVIRHVSRSSRCDKNGASEESSWTASVIAAAYITALEAVSTDLLGLHCFVFGKRSGTTTAATTLFCGNFGLILVNSQWVSIDNGETALKILQKMIQVTMMRGAQSGGVATFHKKKGATDLPGQPNLIGKRSRVVNSKRTDLSKLIVSKLKRDMYAPCGGGGGIANSDMVRMFCGHTRFATSSVANFDGTHPHQWTPPRKRRVHDFVTGNVLPSHTVSNFITHNGDLDFFEINGTTFDLDTIQEWLAKVTECPLPSSVDSVAIAGFVDLLRTKGCFSLSIRYALCFGLSTSSMNLTLPYPEYDFYIKLSKAFEEALEEILKTQKEGSGLEAISSSKKEREVLTSMTVKQLEGGSYKGLLQQLEPNFITGKDEESGCTVRDFARVTIDAFFDNDLMQTTRRFMEGAKGSFGLCVMSSLDAHRQVCIGARGQPMSVTFYPRKGIICYGSEQAAVKAGLNYDTPGGDVLPSAGEENAAVRLDLDDLGGEICLLDWGDQDKASHPIVSPPNRDLTQYPVMDGTVTAVLFQQSKISKHEDVLFHRMTLLEGNEFIKPLQEESSDVVLSDIQSIPRVCKAIQDEWRNVGDNPGFNRLTALNLSRSIVRRMEEIARGTRKRGPGSVDILLTGCEVSLWLAEQFASDLQKAFPKLGVTAVSSNKILGLFGQEQSIPAIGYPMSQHTHDLTDAIVIIVSHSGGTFGPLQCSNLMQSTTKNIFAVTSEWDTQVGKQLRGMFTDDGFLFDNSRIFSTGVGLAPAEPCSVSVAATHQLLTNLFEHICIVIVSNPRYRHASGALITIRDLQILERCNRENIFAMEHIVGRDSSGEKVDGEWARTEGDLRSAGNLWADHVLENARAYIMSFVYIVVAVTTGFPVVSAIGHAAGVVDGGLIYFLRFLDSLIFFWLPQINIMIIRIWQGRDLRHRMVGRTVVVGDVPWVSQSIDAFLSKLFACSYSIAGINVLSANPADHLVHRHTHRVVRGSLLVCGRPDGRLMALTSSEAAVCLSLNQACSIQSIGGTCESITIGHNPFKVPLSKRAIFLDRFRPFFICEKILDLDKPKVMLPALEKKNPLLKILKRKDSNMSESRTLEPGMSSHSLLGVYSDISRSLHAEGGKPSFKKEDENQLEVSRHATMQVDEVLNQMLEEKESSSHLHKVFIEHDKEGKGELDFEAFVLAYNEIDPGQSREEVMKIFQEVDADESGTIEFSEFYNVTTTTNFKLQAMKRTDIRDSTGLVQVEPSTGRVFDEDMFANKGMGISKVALAKGQTLAMELYESRVASMQRFVSMTVMFHQMGKKVQTFFQNISFGMWGYRMDRTHSIVRVATTASPVSGAYVREQMEMLRLTTKVKSSIRTITEAWFRYKEKKVRRLLQLNDAQEGMPLKIVGLNNVAPQLSGKRETDEASDDGSYRSAESGGVECHPVMCTG